MARRIDYGQDAPGLMRGFLAGGVLAGALALGLLWVWPGLWGIALACVAAGMAAYLLGMGGFMIFESRIGKVRDRDAVLDRLPWRGDEVVLDVGCGRGLMLIGAAHRLTTGRAVGIDLWRAEDQARNSAGATLANAALAGVADRVSVQTADMVDLPFGDNSFDLILSAWAVHNLPHLAQRERALAEMVRTLRPGGRLVVTDIDGRADYPRILQVLGASDIRLAVLHPLKDRIMGILSFGSFAPFTVFAQKATAPR